MFLPIPIVVFLLTLSIVSGFSVLDKGPLGSGRDSDLAKYFNSAMLLCSTMYNFTIIYYRRFYVPKFQIDNYVCKKPWK